MKLRKALGQLYQVERTLEAIAKLQGSTRYLPIDLRRIRQNNDKPALARIAEQIGQLMNQGYIMNYVVSCNDPQDRCDVFIVFHDVQPSTEKLLAKLVESYQNWAKRKGFDARLVHEQLADGLTEEAILLIEGVAIYGMLRNESGIHEFVYGDASDRRSSFVNVRVVPILQNNGEELLPVKSEKTNQKGKLIERLTYLSTISDPNSGVVIRLRNDLQPSDAEDVANDFLAAEVRSRREVKPDSEEREKPVRRYNMRPSQLAKDLRTGVVQHDLKKIWNGRIDPFLLSFVPSSWNDEEE